MKRFHRSGFALSDLLACVVICGLTLVYSYAMLGCGDAGKPGDKAAKGGGGKEVAVTDTAAREKEAKEKEASDKAARDKETAEKEAKEKSDAAEKDAKKGLGDALAGLTNARRTARRMQNGTQVRGIQQGMVLYAQGNKSWYPGMTSDGDNSPAITASKTRYGAAGPTPADQSAVIAVLLTGSYFTPEYCMSPLETDTSKKAIGPIADSLTVTKANYSYALLCWSDKTADAGRRAEWTDSNNSRAPVAGDRSKAIDPALATTSLHVTTKTADSKDWQGNIIWNDNHVTFEKTAVIDGDKLKLGNVAGDAGEMDDLFSGAAAGKKLTADANAYFVH